MFGNSVPFLSNSTFSTDCQQTISMTLSKHVPGHGWAVPSTKQKADQHNEWICLCGSHELPPWHFKHRRIISGYRYTPTFYDAFWSLFAWHNESVNMWSHYLATLGLLISIWFTWILNENRFKYADTVSGNHDDRHELAMLCFAALNVCGNALPIFLSAFCHQFYCINKHWHAACWFLDFVGILTVLYGMTVAYILSLQSCWSHFSVRTALHELVPADRFPEFSRVLSTFGFVATAVPVMLVLLLLPEYTQHETFIHILLYSVLGPVCMGLGIFCFAQGNFPERFTHYLGVKEDFFDYLGHSHQWWHLLSAGLQFAWIAMCRLHYETRMQYGCPAQ